MCTTYHLLHATHSLIALKNRASGKLQASALLLMRLLPGCSAKSTCVLYCATVLQMSPNLKALVPLDPFELLDWLL